MKSVVIFSSSGCPHCVKLAKEYGLIQSDLAKLGIGFIVWEQGANNQAVLKHSKGRRAGPSLAALGIQSRLMLPTAFLVSGNQWSPEDVSTDHAFLKDAIAMFDGKITRGPSGEYNVLPGATIPRNRDNIIKWAKADHKLPQAVPLRGAPAPVDAQAKVKGPRVTCSNRFVSSAANGQRRR